jgi:pimeloyl-ACP methyl ester carboxylesterase
MNRRVLSLLLILALTISLIASCGKPKETMLSPSAPEITLTSGYSQKELEEAVSAAGGGCDTGTLTVKDNNDGTYTVECHIGENMVTTTGNINTIPKTVPPKLQTAPCQFNIPLGQTVECGYLIVPEDRSQTDGPTIRLHFAIFKSPSENPAPDPIVYLEGGPGGHALETMSYTFNERFAPFLKNRDFIVFDQRGTGYSEPALDCPEIIDFTYDILDQDLSPEEYSAMGNEMLLSCHDRLVGEGINLAAYNSAESAADLSDLRIALGYEEWNLFGISYGTRLALTAMRDFPDGIRSAILDSTYPLQLNIYDELPVNLDRALDVFFEGCTANPICSKEYPELETVFWEMVDQLDESPITFPVTHALSGETYEVLMDGDSLISFIYQSLYSTEVIPLLPKVIFEVRDGNYTTLALLEGSYLANTELVSTAMQYSVQCNEEVSFITPEELDEVYNTYPELQGIFYELADTEESICATCQNWESEEADPIENEPVYSDIPTLILAGEYDPITPPSWGQIAAETLPSSYYFEFPGVGHGTSVSGKDCPVNIALAFLDDPTSQPDTTCLNEMVGPTFISATMEGIILMPFTNEYFDISGVVPAGWIELSPGIYARSEIGLTVILQQAVWGVPPPLVLRPLFSELGFDTIPLSKASREANGLTWSLYELEIEDLPIDLAVADYAKKDGIFVLIILLQSAGDERDFYYEEVFLPAIDALTPIDW